MYYTLVQNEVKKWYMKYLPIVKSKVKTILVFAKQTFEKSPYRH